MKEIGTVVVLGYLVAATLAEVYIAEAFVVSWFYYLVIGVIAVSEAVLMGAYYMNAKGEPLGIRAIASVGIFFIFVLIVSLLFVYV